MTISAVAVSVRTFIKYSLVDCGNEADPWDAGGPARGLQRPQELEPESQSTEGLEAADLYVERAISAQHTIVVDRNRSATELCPIPRPKLFVKK